MRPCGSRPRRRASRRHRVEPGQSSSRDSTRRADGLDATACGLVADAADYDHAMASPMDCECHWSTGASGSAVREILETLPDWFGITEAVDGYIAEAERSPTLIASIHTRPVGALTLVRHSRDAAEVHLMAVIRPLHRAGIGRRMLGEARRWLECESVRFLQVKTLSARHPDAGYAATRAFYQAMGFVVMEEFPDLWGPRSPAVQLVTYLTPSIKASECPS